jgi:hypothetical protein
MTDPIPMPTAQTSLTPSGSTNASSVGGALAIVLVSLLTQYHIQVDAVTAAAIATLFSAGLGYMPKSGRLPSP